jgi:hypothetical protein
MNDATQFFNAGGGYEIERSLRFNSADSAYLSRTPASAGNRKTWTWAGWVKRSGLGTYQRFFATFDGSNQEYWRFDSDNTLRLFENLGTLQTTQVFRDVSAWYHIVVAVDTTQATASDRIKFYLNGTQVTTFSTATYPSQNADGRFNSAVPHYLGTGTVEYFNGYLADIHFIDGQALDPTSFGKFDTNGVWQPKAYTGSYGTNGFHLPFSDNSTAAALGTDTSGNGNDWTPTNLSVTDGYLPTLPGSGYLDPVTGYYLNGNPPLFLTKKPNGTTIASSVTHGSSTGVTHSVNDVLQWAIDASTGKIWFGRNNTWYASGDPASGANPSVDYGSGASYAAQNLYLGVAYDSPDFQLELLTAPTYSAPSGFSYWSSASTGSWRGSGTKTSTIPNPNGDIFNTRMPSSGKIYFETVIKGGLSLYATYGLMNVGETYLSNDSFVDSPTNYGTDTGAGGEVRGNYCTLNPLDNGGLTLSNGNLQFDRATASWISGRATIGMSSGKWYWEVVQTTGTSMMVGISKGDASQSSYVGAVATGWAYNSGDGNKYNNASNSAYGNTYTTNDVIGVAFDVDSGDLKFYKNGTVQNSGTAAYTGLTSGPYFPAVGLYGTATAFTNFGFSPFAYTAPSGFKALCTTNLPSTTITTSGSYTGNGVADGPFVYLNGVPTAMTVGGNAVTFGTHADKLSNGFKVRTNNTTYNQNAVVYTYSITSTGDPFKTARAQSN